MRNLPKEALALRETDLKSKLEHNEHFNVIVVQETMFTSRFRVFIDIGTKKYELYNQRAKPRTFGTLDTFYKFCQKLGISEALIHVSHNKDGIEKPITKSKD
jgi:hypothetical protein